MSPAHACAKLRPWLIATSLFLSGTTANARWEATEWNMTPEQVAAVMGPAAPLSRGRRGDRLDGKRVGNVGFHGFAGARFRTVYYYDDRGLAQVALSTQSRNCRQIVDALVQSYGEPVRISDQVILRLIIWHDPEAANRIRLLVSAGVCSLHFERLSDYEAVDRAAAN